MSNKLAERKEVLRKFLKDKELTITDFSKILSKSRATVSSWVNSGEISDDNWIIIQNAVKKFDNSTQKLYDSNIDSSENSVNYVSEEHPQLSRFHYFKTKRNEFIENDNLIAMKVPIVPMEAFAQYVDEFYNEAHNITFDYSWVEVDSYGKGNYLQFRVKGDSMNDGLMDGTPDGAVVLTREIGQHLWTGGLYKSKYGHIIITNRNIIFKDIVNFDKETGKVTLHSRNQSPEYADFELRLGECEDDIFVRQIFKVLKRNNM